MQFSGFLHVRENWKKSGNLCGQGKYYFWKVRENDLLSCKLQMTVIFYVSKYQKADKFAAFTECPKARSVSALRGFAQSPSGSPTRAFVVCILLHKYGFIIYDIVYHFWHLYDMVIVSIKSGKLSFHDWKSHGKVREFCCKRFVGTLSFYSVVLSGLVA